MLNRSEKTLLIAYIWGQMTVSGLVNDRDVVRNCEEHLEKERLKIKVTLRDVQKVKKMLLKIKLIEPSNTPMLVAPRLPYT